ncbi:glycosyltransferase [Microbacterium sp.]|uniref:glycosyltransferase n=1 Tax=Microbacterium sp. TaxID=51671 RepID=UPI002810EB1F|nr:glycosyltransferase [Microbacterium sp.]
MSAWRGRERALRADGVDVELITAACWHAGGVPVELDADPDERVRPARTWGSHPALFLYDPRPIWRALAEPWDVVDVHEEPFALSTAEVLLLRMLRRNRSPIVLYTAQNLRKSYPPPFRWLERWALRTAAGVSACNAEAARIAQDKGFPGRARVIPLGVDVEPAVGGEADAVPAEGPVTVGFLGRLVPEKGVSVLLDALRLQPRLRARIAGAGPLAAELPALAAARGVAERVELAGPLAPEQVSEFYRSIDVLAVPSVPTRSWTEQFGRVAVEAMALGVPVVASDAGALPDVVGGAGLIVPAGDSRALARVLLDAAGPQRAELIDAGLERARACSWPAVAAAYRDLYDSVLPVGSPTPPNGPTPVGSPTPPNGPTPVGSPSLSQGPNGDGHSVEVVVVAYGAIGMLRRALAPVAGMPVTVVDNSSLPEIAALCQELGIRYIDPGSNLGFGAAVNVALSDRLLPDADVLLLNPDAEIDRDGITALQRALRADPRLASVGPAQADPDGHTAQVEWPFPAPHRAVLEAVGLGGLAGGPRFVIGSVLLLRAEALAQVGGFDERFFLYAEETDWAYRAHLLGWRHAAVPEVTAVHAAGGTSSDPRRREAHFYASLERYLRKHHGAVGWAVARWANWAGASVRALALRGEERVRARRRAAIHRLGPVRVEARFRARP